jgi:O-antigen/teichoic acid export membrane protein
VNQSFFKTILSHAPKYLTGSVISAGTTLLMTKYYTAVFTPAQYGILALYLMMFQYVMTFSSLNLDSGSTRFYFDYRKTRRDEYLSTIFWLISFISFIIFSIGMVFKDFISNWISPDTGNIYMITLVTGIAGVYVSFLTRILYNEHKSTSVLKQTIFQTFVNHASSFAFISYFNLGILGRMSGQGLGYVLNIFTLFKRFSTENLFKLRLTFNKAMAKETFILTIPGMVAAIQGVAFMYLDRVFLKHYIGDSAVGIYTLGFMLGQGLSMVYEAISQAILPKVFNDMKEDYGKSRIELESFSYKYYIGLIILTFIISALSPIIVSIFANDTYKESANVMPFVMAGFMMGGFYKIPSLVLGFHKVVSFYFWLPFVSFGSNALLNWWLIPQYGIVGAGFASFVGLFIYSIIMQVISFKYMSRKYMLMVGLKYLIVLSVLTLLFKDII